jgi:hypothetical protein
MKTSTTDRALARFVRGFLLAMQSQIEQGDTIRAGDAASRILTKAHLHWRALDNVDAWTEQDAYWMGHGVLQSDDVDIEAATGVSASVWRERFDRLTTISIEISSAGVPSPEPRP